MWSVCHDDVICVEYGDAVHTAIRRCGSVVVAVLGGLRVASIGVLLLIALHYVGIGGVVNGKMWKWKGVGRRVFARVKVETGSSTGCRSSRKKTPHELNVLLLQLYKCRDVTCSATMSRESLP